MAEMGLGYGSEYQLLRFLGHHREELDKLILNATGLSGNINWLDYPYEEDRVSGDGEWKGINCFNNRNDYITIDSNWKKFWPNSGTAMNWDGIFTIDDTWFFVEAKAHKDESHQKCTATSNDSRKMINKAFDETIKWLEAKPKEKWIDTNCYQLANRLAFLYFCHSNKIKARLLYIGFIKGYRRKKDEVQTAEEWMNIWKEELNTLGLDEQKIIPYISFIHPICEKE